jgi:hypothetical protein
MSAGEEATTQRAPGNLVEGARAVLAGNDLGGSTKPAPDLYPHQWNWDSCFIAIGISRYDTARAETEIKSLLRGQWKNGLVPQIVFNPDATGYFPGPDVWQCDRSSDAPSGVQTSGITQPPILATAVRAIYDNASDKASATAFLSDVYPRVVAYHRFLYEQRDPDGSGLIVVVHPWESGLDNSPPYLDAGRHVEMAYRPKYTRLDTLHVAAKNRPTNKDYDLFVYLLEQMRAVNWDQRAYLQQAQMQVQDVLFNAVLCRANDDLAVIAEVVEADPAEARSWSRKTAGAINENLWDQDRDIYFSRDRVTGSLLRDDTLAGFITLFGGVATSERAERMITSRLLSEEEYWPRDGFPVPTTSMRSTWFNPQNYWLGPVWVNTNWMLARGLSRYGHGQRAAIIRERTLDLVSTSGYREYYHPRTGEGFGTDSFSWTAALTIDLVMGE